MSSYYACKAISELDLDPIKLKLMHRESGEGWTPEYANAMETEYRRFLYLMKAFPHEAAAPLVDVDTFWHYHILDTMKYARDCETIFGYFLHHYPYVGLGEEDDPAVHERMGDRMRELYEETFGERYPIHEAQATLSPKNESAFCAAPNQPANQKISRELAFCAAPSKPRSNVAPLATLASQPETAFCAAPSRPVSALAFCAAPSRPVSATAFCAAPSLPISTTAFCAAPSKPVSETAFCAAPSQPARATAFCAAPSQSASAVAFCAAPSRPVKTKTSRTQAFCAAPQSDQTGTPQPGFSAKLPEQAGAFA